MSETNNLAMDVTGECGEFCVGKDILARDRKTERKTGYAVGAKNARY